MPPRGCNDLFARMPGLPAHFSDAASAGKLPVFGHSGAPSYPHQLPHPYPYPAHAFHPLHAHEQQNFSTDKHFLNSQDFAACQHGVQQHPYFPANQSFLSGYSTHQNSLTHNNNHNSAIDKTRDLLDSPRKLNIFAGEQRRSGSNYFGRQESGRRSNECQNYLDFVTRTANGSAQAFDKELLGEAQLRLASNAERQKLNPPAFSFQNNNSNSPNTNAALDDSPDSTKQTPEFRKEASLNRRNEEKQLGLHLMSGQIKKIKFFWRGTNIYYPYTFVRRYRKKQRASHDQYFTEIIDFSKKIIQPNVNVESKTDN